MLLGLGDQLRAAGRRRAAPRAAPAPSRPRSWPPGRAAVERSPALEAEQDADAPRRRLRPDAAAEGVLLLGEADDLAEQLGSAVGLGQTEGDRPTRAARHLAHPRQLGPGAGQVLAVALTEAGWRSRTRPAGAGPARRRWRAARQAWPTCRAPVGRRARCAAASATWRSRAPRPPWPRRPARTIAAMSSVGGGLVVHAALAHGVVAHRAVADHPADVRALGEAVHGSRGTRRRSTQSQGSPSRMASRGMSSTLSISSAR